MTSPAPLDGVRVVDFTWIELGPLCTQILGDFGADVLKIERLASGDPSRDHMFSYEGEDPVFLSLNRNKRSIAIDLKTTEGQELAKSLIAYADVLVENFRPGVMDRLGLGAMEMRALNPRLIYASGTGYGTEGRYAQKGGMDTLAQSVSGMMVANGSPNSPRKVGSPIADHTAGLFLAQGILLALMARERTGQGQVVATSLLDGMVAAQPEGVYWLNTGRTLNWGGLPVDGPFPTEDGFITVVDAFRPRLGELCAVLEIEDLSEDPRYATPEAALAHREELDARLAHAFRTRTSGEWLRRLEAIDFLCAPVLTPEQALEDPQIEQNEMVIEVEHGDSKFRALGFPVKLTDTPARVRLAPPKLGEHTREVLTEIDYDDETIERLYEQGVVR